MLTRQQILRIVKLSRQKKAQREIALLTGHGRETIARILRKAVREAEGDKRGAVVGRRKPRNFVRCDQCGRLVIAPCLACRIERLQMAERFARAA